MLLFYKQQPNKQNKSYRSIINKHNSYDQGELDCANAAKILRNVLRKTFFTKAKANIKISYEAKGTHRLLRTK